MTDTIETKDPEANTSNMETSSALPPEETERLGGEIVSALKTVYDPRVDWCYKTEPDPNIHGRTLRWPRGKVLGGCSSINGLLYVRGQPRDYDHWSQLGNPGWAYRELLPYFRRSEDREGGGDGQGSPDVGRVHCVGGQPEYCSRRARDPHL